MWRGGVPIREEGIPVRYAGEVIAVLGRDSNRSAGRVPSQLESSYLRIAGDLVQMVAQGRFPFEKLMKFYSLDQINQAAQDSENGVTIKPVIRLLAA